MKILLVLLLAVGAKAESIRVYTPGQEGTANIANGSITPSKLDRAYIPTAGGTATGNVVVSSAALQVNGNAAVPFQVGDSTFVVGSNGRVGIGTASPGRTLDVNGAAVVRGSFDVPGGSVTVIGGRISVSTSPGAAFTPGSKSSFSSLYLYSPGFYGLDIGAAAASPFGIWMQTGDHNGDTTTPPLTLQPSGGSVGINLTNPATKFHVAASGSNETVSTIQGTTGRTTTAYIANVLQSSEAAGGSLQGFFALYGDPAIANRRMVIYTYDNAAAAFGNVTFPFGNVAMSTTVADVALNVGGQIRQSDTLACTLGLKSDARGVITGCVSSDARLKKNIKPMVYSESTIDLLRPITYDYKNPSREGPGHQAGFVAQEVGMVIPEAVQPAGNGMKGIRTDAVVAALVLEVQQLRKRVAALEKH